MTTPAAGNKDSSRTLYVAFELSEGKWKLAFRVSRARNARIRTIDAGDREAVETEIARAKAKFGLAEDASVLSCYEAGREGFWVHRFLESMDVVNLVVDSSSIEVSRRKRRAKTDRLDAGKLVTMLMRWDDGEKGVWSVVNVPSEEAEDERHLHRELVVLKRERTRIANRVRGLLASHGLKVGTIGKNFATWLNKARRWDGSRVPQGLAVRILIEVDRLQYVRAQILAVEKERRRLLKEGQSRGAAVARELGRLRGIGVNASWAYSTELFAWREFRNRKQVGSIAGLTATPYDSGGSSREQGIDKAGNQLIRSLSVEIAWGWLRFQPNSALSRWYQERYGDGSKRIRKIGIVALARKLLIALWRWVDQGVLPEGATLKS